MLTPNKTLETARRIARKMIEAGVARTCEACNGSGFSCDYLKFCPVCKGVGSRMKEKA